MKTKEEIRKYNAEKTARYRANLSTEKRKEIRLKENQKRREKYSKLTEIEKIEKAIIFKKWYEKNKHEYIKRVTKKRDERLKTDLNFKLRFRCNARLRTAIRAQNGKKANSTIDLLGCSPIELRQHLEKQFDNKMNWDNYGTYWHIDHIRPCASFDLTKPEEQKKCFHYTNLQPLEATANIKKGALFQAPPV